MGLFHFGKKNSEEKKASGCGCSPEERTKETPCCCGSEEESKEATGCCCGPDEKAASCCCGSTECTEETACCGETGDVASIKILGAGCKSCHEQYENAKAAVQAMGLNAAVEYITDMEKVMAYGVMRMPAIVVNEKVVSMGKVLKAADVEKLLRKLGL